MTEIVMSWPWYDRLIVGAVLMGIIYMPYNLSRQLEALGKQNERIITLLASIHTSTKR